MHCGGGIRVDRGGVTAHLREPTGCVILMSGSRYVAVREKYEYFFFYIFTRDVIPTYREKEKKSYREKEKKNS